MLCIKGHLYSEMQKRTAAPNFDIMKLLLSHGADPNQKIFDLRPGVKFMSLLHIVAKSTCLKRYSLITMVISIYSDSTLPKGCTALEIGGLALHRREGRRRERRKGRHGLKAIRVRTLRG
jgi:hypothetical protein